MDTPIDRKALRAVRDLVEARAEVYGQAGRDATVAHDAECNGERLERARARWKTIVASATNPDHTEAFDRAARAFLETNEAVGRAEAEEGLAPAGQHRLETITHDGQ